MLKSMAVATAALAIAGSSIVYAQQRVGGPGDCGAGDRFERHYRPSVDDIKAFAEARIAALKAGLMLTPDQEKNWPPFEQALRDLVKQHIARVKAREAAGEQPPPADLFTRLQRRAGVMAQVSTALKHVADAGEPLYQSLNDAQKHRFTVLAHILRPHWLAGGLWQEHRGRGMMMGREFGDGGMHGMMGRGRDNGGGMMGPDPDNGGRGMMGPDRDQDSDRL